jgi:hypothetical protein
MQIVDAWEYPELLRLRDLISEAYKQKAEEAKAAVIAETQWKFEQLGLSFDDVVAMQKKRKRAVRTPAVPKYRSPDKYQASIQSSTIVRLLSQRSIEEYRKALHKKPRS